ncbi:low molecular weight protein arginine phosphatase [bacterium]
MSQRTCNVLFVCTGNLCRSPIAEGILKKKLNEKGIQHIHATSAGLMAPTNSPATRLAQSISNQYGVDISQHLSQFLSAELVNDADIILVMERIHQKEIEGWFHPKQKKVFLLKAFGTGGEDEEVDDPIGGNQEVFELCFQLIESEINRILPELLNICDSKSKGENKC